MSLILQIVAITICILALGLLFKRMKQKSISVEQALYWLSGVLGMLILACFPSILGYIADVLGIWWAPAALVFFLLVVIIVIIFNHTEAIARMDAEIKELGMQVVLLKEEIREIKESLDQMKGRSL